MMTLNDRSLTDGAIAPMMGLGLDQKPVRAATGDRPAQARWLKSRLD
jgi:hypothetical protein